MIDTSLSFSGLQIMTHSNRSRSRHPAFKLVEWGSEMILIGREFSRLPGRLSGQHRSLVLTWVGSLTVWVGGGINIHLEGSAQRSQLADVLFKFWFKS